MDAELGLPETPVGRQVGWFLTHNQSQGRDLTVDDVAAHIVFPRPWDPEQGLKRFREGDPRPYHIAKVKEASPYQLDVVLDYGDDRPWSIAFSVDEQPPHRIVRMFWSRAIAEDIVIRPAAASDGAALNDLEIRAPMQLGKATVTYDRGHDFLGFGRLMGDNICFVAEREGKLLGLACGASHPVRIGGKRYTVMLLHRLRVPAEQRKAGIFSSLNSQVFGAFDGRTDGAYGYTALENAEGMRIGGPQTWSITVYRTVLDCAALAGAGQPSRHARTATPADAGVIVDILNQAHDEEEAYLPYTVETFTERMSRAPDLYTWEHVLIGEGAVVGVWPARLEVTTELEGGVGRSTRGAVLDHGFVPGASEELVALLRSWARRLQELGHTEMSFITSEGSPTYPVVSPLAAHTDPFSFRMAVDEPPGTRERGLYVDAIYF